jgi:DNA-binding protein HU-beta
LLDQRPALARRSVPCWLRARAGDTLKIGANPSPAFIAAPVGHWYKGWAVPRSRLTAQRYGQGITTDDACVRIVGAGSVSNIPRAARKLLEGVSMNKTDLINAIADHADLTKADAGRALDAVTDQIKRALKKGDDVSLVGFGTFVVRKRAARSGRNPRTGATIKIKASKVPAFKAGKALKDALN